MLYMDSDSKRGKMAKVPSALPPEEVTSNNFKSTTADRINNRLEWWYRFSAPAQVAESANFIVREQYRRGRVASLIILVTLCAIILLLPIIITYAPVPFNLPWVFASAVTGVLCCLLAIAANRSGRVQLAGILLIV